jgi:hypothetical protein
MTEVLAPDIYRAHWENPLGKPPQTCHPRGGGGGGGAG